MKQKRRKEKEEEKKEKKTQKSKVIIWENSKTHKVSKFDTEVCEQLSLREEGVSGVGT